MQREPLSISIGGAKDDQGDNINVASLIAPFHTCFTFFLPEYDVPAHRPPLRYVSDPPRFAEAYEY